MVSTNWNHLPNAEGKIPENQDGQLDAEVTIRRHETPGKNPYDHLKEMILKLTDRSKKERIRDVFQNTTRRDRTPAQLLLYMKSQLGSKHVSETVLQTLWMNRLLPSVTQIIVPMSWATPLGDLADYADLVFMHSNHDINTVQVSKPTESQPINEIKAMKEMMMDLQRQLKEMRVTKRQGRTPSYQRRPRIPSRCRNDDADVCWYHQRYGEQAKKCRPHCKFTSALEKLGNRRVTTTNSSGDEHKECRLLFLGSEE